MILNTQKCILLKDCQTRAKKVGQTNKEKQYFVLFLKPLSVTFWDALLYVYLCSVVVVAAVVPKCGN